MRPYGVKFYRRKREPVEKNEKKTKEDENTLVEGHVVKDRWKVICKIGQGAFGEVYKCDDVIMDEYVAVKTFCKCSPPKTQNSFLKAEVHALREMKGKSYFPTFIGFGKNERFEYLVMELLGENLHQLKKRIPGKKFTLSTAVRLGEMMLTSVHNMHLHGLLHKDIKPTNFAVGYGADVRKLYIIDFGFSKKYREKGELLTCLPKVSYKGTPRYSSARVLRGKDASRADDLIALFYSLFEIFVGDLPWKNIKDHIQMARIKEDYDHKILLEQLPVEFFDFYDHVSSLSFYDDPDYSRLYKVFHQIKARRAIRESDDFDFEVEMPRPEKIQKRGSTVILHPSKSDLAIIENSSVHSMKVAE